MLKICPNCKAKITNKDNKCDMCKIKKDKFIYEYKNIKLWNPKVILFLSIFLSPSFALLLCALNFNRLDNKEKCIEYIINANIFFGIIQMVGNKTGYISFYPIAITIAIFIGIHINNKQKEIYIYHIKNNGRKASFILPVVIWITASIIDIYLLKV